MPKPKWNLNAVYISERLQESLRPISRCALTTVVAPMGYGKTTAVNWYLEERARAEAPKIIRISVYSDNLAIFWKSVQDAFDRAGFDFLRDHACPADAASGALLVDALCHEPAGEPSCYIFLDDFHLLTDRRARRKPRRFQRAVRRLYRHVAHHVHHLQQQQQRRQLLSSHRRVEGQKLSHRVFLLQRLAVQCWRLGYGPHQKLYRLSARGLRRSLLRGRNVAGQLLGLRQADADGQHRSRSRHYGH